MILNVTYSYIVTMSSTYLYVQDKIGLQGIFNTFDNVNPFIKLKNHVNEDISYRVKMRIVFQKLFLINDTYIYIYICID